MGDNSVERVQKSVNGAGEFVVFAGEGDAVIFHGNGGCGIDILQENDGRVRGGAVNDGFGCASVGFVDRACCLDVDTEGVGKVEREFCCGECDVRKVFGSRVERDINGLARVKGGCERAGNDGVQGLLWVVAEAENVLDVAVLPNAPPESFSFFKFIIVVHEDVASFLGCVDDVSCCDDCYQEDEDDADDPVEVFRVFAVVGRHVLMWFLCVRGLHDVFDVVVKGHCRTPSLVRTSASVMRRKSSGRAALAMMQLL